MQWRVGLRQLGPGLLFAGAAIGVSHLVQSTRAGALYGFDLLWVVLVIHLVKYPFFQYGPRYVAATGESLLEGYKSLGNWAVALFLCFTLATVFTIQAAVTLVTAGILSFLTGLSWAPWLVSLFILVGCGVLLWAERFVWLEKSIRLIILLLTIATLITVLVAGSQGYAPPQPTAFDWRPAGIGFLLALMGWMPSPLDLSVWMSIWNTAKNKSQGSRQSLRATLFDFNSGYWGTMLMACAFLALGAWVLHGRGIELATGGAAFTGQLIEIYTLHLGAWMYWVIGVAALATMLSTTLTVLDAIPRVLHRTIQLLVPDRHIPEKVWYRGFLIMLIVGATLLLSLWASSMTAMVTLATILSFLTAPYIAILNYRLVTAAGFPESFRPGWGLHLLSWIGIAFFFVFSGWYIYVTWGQ